jgi:hypothetical protein
MSPEASHSHSCTHSRSVEIVIPVFNEQRVLADNVRALHTYMRRHFNFLDPCGRFGSRG